MADLEFIIRQVEKEIRVDATGKGFASIAGTARLCGVAKSTLSEAFGKSTGKLCQTLTIQGFEPVSFSETGVPDIAVALIVSYYANKAGERCTEEARLVNDALLSVGVRSWMQQVTGWEKSTTRSDEKWRSLPPSTLAAMTAKSVKTIQSALGDVDPRLAQILIDVSMRTIDHIGTPSLPPSTEPEYAGVVEIAQELGFKVDKQESKLGRFVAKAFRDAGLGDPLTAKRECGGAMRSLKVYPKNEPIVISAIKEFFA